MHPVRRRKKRPSNGIRTVEVCRGSNGFGFTISGQQPCLLSSIVRDSPAERAGLRYGDYLVAVNGQNVSKVSHDDVVRLIGSSSGLLKLQIAENYYSDSSEDEHVVSVRSKPKHAHKARNRVAKVVQDLRSGVMFEGEQVGEDWETPEVPPPRFHPFQPKEELCFFLGYLGTIEMPKLIQPGSRSQVVRCCVKRMRAEKRTHTWVVMRVHSEGVTLTGHGGSLLADYPVGRICFCGPSADDDRKYVGLITSGPIDGDAAPSSACHIFAVQANLAEHAKHGAKTQPFKITCTSGQLSDGCFEFPSTSEPVLNAVRSFCLTKDEERDNVVVANSPQPSQAGSTAASSNSDSGIGFRDDCGNQSDRIVMVDIENQRLHIQQLCDDGKTLDIQLGAAGARPRLDAPSANLQHAFACVSALCPLPDNKTAEPVWPDDSVFQRLGGFFGQQDGLSVSYGDGDVIVRNPKNSIYFQSTDSFDMDSYKLSPKVFGLPRPLVTQSMEELATPPPPAPPQLWGSLQNLPLHSFATTNEAIDDKEEDNKSSKNDETAPDNAISFEKLVADPLGLEMFTEFLKKEFSEENMTFWRSCEDYGELTEPAERRKKARAIFDAHLAEGAPEPVNVDAHARQHAANFESAPADLFVAAQKQVINLMKFDSFPRFLKSDLYQEYLGENQKLKKSQSDGEDRRRKSLLPWARKGRSKSKDRGEAELHLSLQRKSSEDAVSVGSRSSLASWDAALRGSLSRQSLISRDGEGTNALVRIVFADGSTAVIQLRPGESVRELMERVLAKRGLSYNAFEAYSLVNNKVIALDEDSASLANQQIRLEQRVIFRLDLPNRKTVSVKAKATKTLAQVLRPVLHKYNYPMELVTICSVSENTVLELSVPISTIDGRRLTVLTRSSSTMPPPAPPVSRTYVRPGTSLDEITNKVFEEVLQGKSSCGSSAAGSVRSETSTSTMPLPLPRFLRRDSTLEKLRLRNRKSGKVAVCGSDSDDLYEGLKRAQRSRLEDQRGTEINFELPEFLKDKENSPQSVKKMRKLRQDAPATVETKESIVPPPPLPEKPSSHQDDEKNRGHVARAVTCKTYETAKSKSPIMFEDEKQQQQQQQLVVVVKQTPPPLPPKPKLYNLPKDSVLRNHNINKPIAKLNRSRRAAFLDQTTGSFV